MKTIIRSALVGYSATDMYSLVEDIERYPEFLPWCRSTRVPKREPGRTIATLTVGVRGIQQTFTTENTNRTGEAIDMRLVEGPFRRFSAAWRFQALGPQAAKIEFSLTYEFASSLIAKVLEPLFDHIANTMVDAFIRRAEALYGQARG